MEQRLLSFDATSLRQTFESAEPFHHLVIDDFLDPLLAARAELELRTLPEEKWYDKTSNFQFINNQADGPTQSKKIALNDRAKIPEITRSVLDFFQSENMLQFLSQITGIDALLPDEELIGGGVHRTTTDGHLAIHSDFNIHPTTKKHRRVNALLYLNTGWQKEHQGELELWSRDMQRCVTKVAPVSNRLIVFRITDDALHGNPTRWSGDVHFPRMSLALYYYTDDRPEEEKAPAHWAVWHKRFGEYY